MSKKLWITGLFAFILVLAACSSSEPTTTPDTGDIPEDAQNVDADDSTVTGDVILVAPVGAASDGFEQTELTGPADDTFTIQFDNNDEGVPHNVQITDSKDKVVFEPADGETITGVASTVYNIENLKAGSYGYNCQLHPATMTGTLTVA